MEQTLNKIEFNLKEYNSLFSKNEFYPLQKAYTTPHFVVLQVRVPGKTLSIYLGRGNQYAGVFIANKAPPAFLRIQDRFLDFIRSHLVGAKLSLIEYNEETSRYKIVFKTQHVNNYFEFGYHNRELFFVLKEGELIFTSWNNQINKSEPDDYPKADLEKIYFNSTIEEYLKDEDAKSNGVIVIKKREKFLQRKIENISKDIEQSSTWKELEDKIKNDQFDLNVPELKYRDLKINFIGLKSDWEKRDLVFKRIKKLKRGESVLKERLIEAQNEYNKIKSGELKIETTKEKAIQVYWKVGGNKNTQKSAADGEFLEFKIFQLSGLLGLNAGGNDKIRSMASKDHYWFHIENYPGSHIILKTDDISKITPEIFEIIASMLRDYSKLSIQQIPVMFTQVKNLKGIKGVKGEVSMKKVKYITCPYRSFKEIISIV